MVNANVDCGRIVEREEEEGRRRGGRKTKLEIILCGFSYGFVKFI
jgi:hypothetical protein